jgi:hypothetical protein
MQQLSFEFAHGAAAFQDLTLVVVQQPTAPNAHKRKRAEHDDDLKSASPTELKRLKASALLLGTRRAVRIDRLVAQLRRVRCSRPS